MSFVKFVFLSSLFNFVNSAVIEPPNNIVCFPERDFCTIEGFVNLVGQILTVDVTRDGKTVGSANGKVSGDPALAFEINHPGGLCWGEGTTLKVTPDIIPGDLVTIKSGSLPLGDMVISNGYVTGSSITDKTVSLFGFLDTNVIKENIEVRIVNPLLLDTAVQKRQVGAVFGPVVREPGYSSSVQIDGTKFTATFTFDTQQAADIAASGEGYRILMWMKTGLNGFRQGLTISEFGEIGGPYSTICPNSPNNVAIPIPLGMGISDKLIKWHPSEHIVSTSEITGFSVNLLKGNVIYGYRIAKTINQVDFDLIPFANGDKVEIRSMVNDKMSDPLIFTYEQQDIIPTINYIPAQNTEIVETELVILSSNTGQIAYTLDESPVVINNKLSDKSILYTKPIHITNTVTITSVAFDRSGKFSEVTVGKFTKPAILKPLPVSDVTVVSQNGGIIIRWTKPNDASISGFKVEIYKDNVPYGTARIVTNTELTIKDLTPGVFYQFSVYSINEGGNSDPSILTNSIEFPNPTDIIIITTSIWKRTDFRVIGTSTEPNIVITLHYTNADNTIGEPILNAITRSPITGTTNSIPNWSGAYDFNIRVRGTNVPRTNPGRISIKSNKGGLFIQI